MRASLLVISLAILIASAGAAGNIKTITGINLGGLGNISQVGQGEGEQEENWQGGQAEWGSQALPELINVSKATTIVYIGETSIPLASYQTTFGKFLWIENYRGLSEYASIPQYSGLSLIAYTSTGGQGEFLEMYPSDSLNQGL